MRAKRVLRSKSPRWNVMLKKCGDYMCFMKVVIFNTKVNVVSDLNCTVVAIFLFYMSVSASWIYKWDSTISRTMSFVTCFQQPNVTFLQALLYWSVFNCYSKRLLVYFHRRMSTRNMTTHSTWGIISGYQTLDRARWYHLWIDRIFKMSRDRGKSWGSCMDLATRPIWSQRFWINGCQQCGARGVILEGLPNNDQYAVR